MRRPRACLARHAPGRRRGSAWRPIGAARQELADGGRHIDGRPRKARPGAARKTPQINPDCASLSGWRAERRPVFPRGNAGTQRTMVAPLGAPSPSLWRGEKRENGRRAYPGPRQTIRVMMHGCLKTWLFERLAAERTRTPHPSNVMAGLVPAIARLTLLQTGMTSSSIPARQTWMPATSAGMTVERSKRDGRDTGVRSTPSFGRLCPAMTDEGLCILYEPGHDGRETV